MDRITFSILRAWRQVLGRFEKISPAERVRALDLGADNLIDQAHYLFDKDPASLSACRAIYANCCIRLFRRIKNARRPL